MPNTVDYGPQVTKAEPTQSGIIEPVTGTPSPQTDVTAKDGEDLLEWSDDVDEQEYREAGD